MIIRDVKTFGLATRAKPGFGGSLIGKFGIWELGSYTYRCQRCVVGNRDLSVDRVGGGWLLRGFVHQHRFDACFPSEELSNMSVGKRCRRSAGSSLSSGRCGNEAGGGA